MLTAIRERITGWFAWAFVILICFVFVLWGVGAYFEENGEYSVATVNGEAIPLQVYRDQLTTQQQRLTRRLGSDFDVNSLDSLGVKQQILQSLIDTELLEQYVEERGMRISDADIQRQILLNDLFLEKGSFSVTRYEDVLASNRMTPQMYEEWLRSSSKIDQLQRGIVNSAIYTNQELDALLAQEEQIRVAEYVEIRVSDYATPETAVSISNEEILAYYNLHKSDYFTEPRIRVAYVQLMLDDVISNIRPEEKEIQAYYETTKGRYISPETRRASHILIGVGADEASRQDKLVLANALATRIAAGENFAQLARQYSDDSGSKNQGGDIGIIARGQVEKPIEDVIYSLQEGEVSEPIETRFGYHIIKLNSFKPVVQKSLQDVRDLVEADFKQQQAEELFFSMVEEFKNLVFEEPDSIDIIAESMELKVETSDWFSKSSGAGVFADSQIKNAAFSDDVLLENLVSVAVELSPTDYIALQKVGFEDAVAIPLAQVREQIVALLNIKQARQQVEDAGNEFYTELLLLPKSAAGWKEFLQKNQFSAKKFRGKKSQIPMSLDQLGSALFKLSVPAIGEYQYGHIKLTNGDVLIFALQQAVAGSSHSDAKDRLKQQLIEREGVIVFAQLLERLRMNAEIVVYEDQL